MRVQRVVLNWSRNIVENSRTVTTGAINTPVVWNTQRYFTKVALWGSSDAFVASSVA